MSNYKIYLTESQINEVIKEQIIVESLFNKNMSKDEIVSKLKRLAAKGLLTASIMATVFSLYQVDERTRQDIKQRALAAYEKSKQEGYGDYVYSHDDDDYGDEYYYEDEKEDTTWKLASSNVKATVYNALPSQCNNDISHTASMFRLNLNDVLSHRIIAMERTFMKKLGLSYGDVVKIEGTGKWDGIWQVQDTMNRKFAGQEKIDILVPNNIKGGKWDNVKLYTLADDLDSNDFKSEMAPQLSKSQSLKQARAIRNRR